MNPSNDSMTLQEFESLAVEKLRELRSAGLMGHYQGAQAEALLWAAFAPYWTAELADLSGFPVRPAASAFERLLKDGFVRVTRARTPDGKGLEPPVYTVKDSVRNDVLRERATGSAALDGARELVARIGRQMLAAYERGEAGPVSLRRWAALAARAEDSEALVAEFNRLLSEAGRDTAQIIDWKNAAQQLSALLLCGLDDSLNQALQRATRLLELIRRREHDEQHLRYFKERDEQREAYRRLMRGPDELWATHFIGAGGVGKTMLVRKIMAHWAEEEGALAARIDFDYLNADYPTLAPGVLLWFFAQDLLAHADEEAVSLFKQADQTLNRLSQILRSHSAQGAAATSPTAHPLFRDAITLYIKALRRLPRRVLLIADTCEELTKGSIGLARQNVFETFRILRALHDGPGTLDGGEPSDEDGIPGLRVIFSGRRPLAGRGHGWSCPAAAALDERPFLRLHEIRGFLKQEARDFLKEVMAVPAELVEAVVTRSSPDTGGVSVIEYEDPAEAPLTVQRCNPYDLRLYAEWAKDTLRPTAEEILYASSARYVELRILQRLDSPQLEEILPGVSLLGHFDLETLHKIYPDKKPDAVATAFEKLQAEEWISQRYAPAPEGRPSRLILSVETGLRQRLYSYFRQKADEVQPLAADHLEEVTLRRDLQELDWTYFVAALRVMEADADPQRAARWWKRAEARMIAERPPEWVLSITKGLQGEGSTAAPRDPTGPPDAPPESPLRASIIATHAAARMGAELHAPGPGGMSNAWREAAEVWKEVAAKADLHPLPEEARRLKLRALAGSITSALALGDTVEPEQLASLDLQLHLAHTHVSDPLSALALVAVVEAVIEEVERRRSTGEGDAHFTTDGFVAMRLGDLLSDTEWELPVALPDSEQAKELQEDLLLLSSYASCLTARAMLLSNSHRSEAEVHFESALIRTPEHRPSLTMWGAWLPPDDITARIRLEFVRASYPSRMSAAGVLSVVGDWEIKLHSVDSDRLHSALLMLELACGPVHSNRLAKLGWADLSTGRFVLKEKDLTPGPEACNAHRATPPLFVTVCEILAANGQADEALQQLGVALKNSAKHTLDTLLHAERAGARIVWRMRMQDVGEKADEGLSASHDPEDLSLLWTLDALDGPKSSKGIPAPPPTFWTALGADLPATSPELLISGSDADAGPQPNELLSKQLKELLNAVADGDPQPREEARRAAARIRHVLAWTHAAWQTRYALDPGHAAQACEWATRHLFVEGLDDSVLPVSRGGRHHTPALYPGDSAALNFLIASTYLDAEEARLLALEHGRKPRDVQPTVFRRVIRLLEEADFKESLSEHPDWALTLWLRALGGGPNLREILPLVKRLGARRAAEIAWREGELLALRLPSSAMPLLTLASTWFAECGDDVGVVIAGTTKAMIYGRLGDEAAMSGDMMTVARAYDSLRQREKGTGGRPLPSLNELDNMAAPEGGKAYPDGWAERCWRPWLVRLMLCRKLLFGDKKMAAALSQTLILTFLSLAYAHASDGSRLLPADLHAWIEGVRPKPSLLRRAFESLRRGAQALYRIGAAIFVIGAILTGFRLIYKGIIWAASWVLDTEGMGEGWRIAFVGVFVLWLALVIRFVFLIGGAKPDPLAPTRLGRWVTTYPPWKFVSRLAVITFVGTTLVYLSLPYYPLPETIKPVRFIRAFVGSAVATTALLVLLVQARMMLTSPRRYMMAAGEWLYNRRLSMLFKLTVRLDARASGGGVSPTGWMAPEADFEVRQSWLAAMLLGLFMKRSGARPITLETTSAEPYALWIKRASQDASESRMKVRWDTERLNDAGIPVDALVVTGEGAVNGPCWEAVYVPKFLTAEPESLTAEWWGAAYLMRFSRSLTNARQTMPTLSDEMNIIVALTEGDIARGVATEGWSPLTARPDFDIQTRLESVESSRRPSQDARVLHLVGTPEETITGVHFRVGGESSSQLSLQSQTMDSDMSDAAGVLRAEDLTRALPELVLCVIQMEPRGAASGGTEAGRRSAALGRVLASKFFAQGVPAVLFLPAVEPQLASDLVTHLARHLANQPYLIANPERALKSLPKAAAGMRAVIGRAGDKNAPEGVRETMLDVCLYLNR